MKFTGNNPNARKLFDLKEGERFYFLSDRGRKVWEVESIAHKNERLSDWRVEHAEHSVFIKNDLNVRKEKTTDAEVVMVGKK